MSKGVKFVFSPKGRFIGTIRGKTVSKGGGGCGCLITIIIIIAVAYSICDEKKSTNKKSLSESAPITFSVIQETPVYSKPDNKSFVVDTAFVGDKFVCSYQTSYFMKVSKSETIKTGYILKDNVEKQ